MIIKVYPFGELEAIFRSKFYSEGRKWEWELLGSDCNARAKRGRVRRQGHYAGKAVYIGNREGFKGEGSK